MGDEVWDELEELLISADVGVATTGKLIGRVRERLAQDKIKEGALAHSILKAEMVDILKAAVREAPDNLSSPRVILVVGVNGGGKTTSIAKLAWNARNQGRKVILAAADTFRAAAIDQLKRLGEMAGVEVIAHQPGADPGAVVFDAAGSAQSAGRRADY